MGKTGVITTQNKDNEAYHDVIALFKIYRSVSWRMQVTDWASEASVPKRVRN